MPKYQLVTGVKDVLPPQVEIFNFVTNKAKEIFEVYGYKEIIPPILEYTDLFRKSTGENTDIVKKEMYTFKDNEKEISLRPEATPSIVRAYIEYGMYKKNILTKLYCIGPFFRKERPQAGRFRQFTQIDVEAIGVLSPLLDAEAIFMLMEFFSSLNLSSIKLLINSIGCKNCRSKYTKQLESYFLPNENLLCTNCKERIHRNILRILDCKNENCQKIIENCPSIQDFLCNECYNYFNQVKNYLKKFNVEFIEDKRLVRGLDYYTRTTFEVIDTNLGAKNALAGGGRYDDLVEQFGGPPTPAIGFAIGVDRVIQSIEKNNISVGTKKDIKVFIITLIEEAQEIGFRIAKELRKNNIATEMNFIPFRSLKAQLHTADRMNVKYAVIIGENELKQGFALLRNMKMSEQKEVPFDKVVEYIKNN
jgi:histidyl-tRNA synthetase